MLAVTVFYYDRDGDSVSSMYLCDCVAVNEISDLVLHFSDGMMRIEKEAYAHYIVYPHNAGTSRVLAPNNPALMKMPIG